MADNTSGPLSRQQLYDRIRESSKDEYILEEMKRLGFWPESEGQPTESEQLIKHKGELQRELRDLLAKQARMSDPEKALREMRKQRMLASRKRREETKQRKLDETYQRAVAWHEKQQKQIPYAGEGVSAGLSGTEFNQTMLDKYQLPNFSDSQALASAMGVTVPELRFLTYSRKASKISHYVRFEIPKKTGGNRQISTPMPRLKRLQYWVLDNIINKVNPHHAAHGFIQGRSIVSNAKQHVAMDLVINIDLENFFPTITYKRVKGLFAKWGYSEQIATLLALLCTEQDVDELDLDNELYYVAKGDRRLPQGAPSSPAISNALCYRLDCCLINAAKSLGFNYSRYADDLTFSAKQNQSEHIGKLMGRIYRIVGSEGFKINKKKTRVMRKGAKREVTGVIVNDKLGVDRKMLRRFKAFLHQTELDGLEGRSWGNGSDVISSMVGYAHFVKMVDADKGDKFLIQIKRIREKYSEDYSSVTKGKPHSDFRKLSSASKPPLENWWQPKAKPVPVKLVDKKQVKKQLLADSNSGQGAATNRQSNSASSPQANDSFNLTPANRASQSKNSDGNMDSRRDQSAPTETGKPKNVFMKIFVLTVLVLMLFQSSFSLVSIAILAAIIILLIPS